MDKPDTSKFRELVLEYAAAKAAALSGARNNMPHVAQEIVDALPAFLDAVDALPSPAESQKVSTKKWQVKLPQGGRAHGLVTVEADAVKVSTEGALYLVSVDPTTYGHTNVALYAPGHWSYVQEEAD